VNSKDFTARRLTHNKGFAIEGLGDRLSVSAALTANSNRSSILACFGLRLAIRF
jgi:hypothetical protein